MPSQVYRFDPDTGAVKIVADGFDKCNGIAFSSDGKLAYMWVIFFPCSILRYLLTDINWQFRYWSRQWSIWKQSVGTSKHVSIHRLSSRITLVLPRLAATSSM